MEILNLPVADIKNPFFGSSIPNRITILTFDPENKINYLK